MCLLKHGIQHQFLFFLLPRLFFFFIVVDQLLSLKHKTVNRSPFLEVCPFWATVALQHCGSVE